MQVLKIEKKRNKKNGNTDGFDNDDNNDYDFDFDYDNNDKKEINLEEKNQQVDGDSNDDYNGNSDYEKVKRKAPKKNNYFKQVKSKNNVEQKTTIGLLPYYHLQFARTMNLKKHLENSVPSVAILTLTPLLLNCRNQISCKTKVLRIKM